MIIIWYVYTFEKSSSAVIKSILNDFLSSYDFGDSDINETFKSTADHVIPEILTSLFVVSHFESTDKSLSESIIDNNLKKFFHGLMLIVFGLHNLETLVEFEKHMQKEDKLQKSLAFTTGGLCIAKASLILKDENDKVLTEIYNLISVSAMAELKRRKWIGRLGLSKEDYLSLCRDLASPLKLFVAGPSIRNSLDPLQLERLVKFVECVDVANRLIKELNICLNIEGNLEKELKSEQCPLIFHLGSQNKTICKDLQKIINKPISEAVIKRISLTLVTDGYFEQVHQIIEQNIDHSRQILSHLKNSYSKQILQNIVKHTEKLFSKNKTFCSHLR